MAWPPSAVTATTLALALALITFSPYCSFALHLIEFERTRKSSHFWPPSGGFNDSLTHLISTYFRWAIAVAVLYLDPCIIICFSTNSFASGLVALIVLLRPFYVAGAAVGTLAQSVTQGQGQRQRRDKGSSRLLLPWLPLVTSGAAILWAGLLASYGIFSYTAQQVVIVILLFLALLVNTACLVALMVVLQWSRSQGGAESTAAAATTSNGRPSRIDSRNTTSTTTMTSTPSFSSSSSMLVTPRRVQAAARGEFEVMLQQARRASGILPQQQLSSHKEQPLPQPQLRCTLTPLPPGTAEKLRDAFVHNGVGRDAQHEAHDDPFGFLEALALAAAHDPTSTKAIDEALTRLYLCLASQWLACATAVPWLLYPLFAPKGQAGTPMPRGLFLLFACGAVVASLLPTLHALLSRDKRIPEVAPLRPQPRRSASAPLGATHWRKASATIKTRVASLGSLWRGASTTAFNPNAQQEKLTDDKHTQRLEPTNDNSIIIHPSFASSSSFSSTTLLSSPGQGRNEHYQSATPFASPARVPGAYAHPAMLSFTFGDASSSGIVQQQGEEVSSAVLLPPISAGTSLGNSFVYHDAGISTYPQQSSAAAAVEEEQERDVDVDEQNGEAWHSFAAAEPVADKDAALDGSFGLAQDLKLGGSEEIQGLELSNCHAAALAPAAAHPERESQGKPHQPAPPTIPTSQPIFLLSPPRPVEPRSHFSSPTASSSGMTSVSYSTSFSVLSDRKREGSPARQLGQEQEQPLCSSPVRGRSSGRGGNREEEVVVVMEEGVAEKVGSSFISLQTIAAVTSCCELEEGKQEVMVATAEDVKGSAAAQEEEADASLPQSSATSRIVGTEEEEGAARGKGAAAANEPPPLPLPCAATDCSPPAPARPATALSYRHSAPLATSATTPELELGRERPSLRSTLGLALKSSASTPSSASQALRRRSLGSELGLRNNDAHVAQPSSKPASATKTTATQGQGIQTTSTPPAAAAAAADCTLSSFTSSLLLSPDVSPDKCETGILAAVLAPLSPEVDAPSTTPELDEEDVGEESGPVRLDLRGLTPLQLHAYKWPHGNLSTVAEQSEEFREGAGSDAGSQQVEDVDVAGPATAMQVSQGEDDRSGGVHASGEACLPHEELDATLAANEVSLDQNPLDDTVSGDVGTNCEVASSSFIGAAPFHSSATPYRTTSIGHDLASLSPFTLAEETMECLLNTSAVAAAAAATAASCVRMTPLDYGFAPPLPPTSPLSISSSSYEFVHPLVTSPERRNSLLVSNTPPARHHPQGRGRRSLLLAEKLGAKRRPRSVSGLLGMGGGSGSSKRSTINKDAIGLPLCNVAAAERNPGEKLLPQLPGEACNPALFYGNDSLLLQNAQYAPVATRAALPPPPPTAWRATEDSMDDRIATAVEMQYAMRHPAPAPATCDTSATSTIAAGSVVIHSIKRKAVPSQQQEQRLSAAFSSPPSTMTNARRAAKSQSLPPRQPIPITPARTEELRNYAQADAGADAGLQVAIDAALCGGCPSISAWAAASQEQDENSPPEAVAMRLERSSMPPLRPQRPRRPLEPFVPTTNANTTGTATSSGKGKAALRPAANLLPLAQARAPRAPMPRRHVVSVAPECLRKNGGWI